MSAETVCFICAERKPLVPGHTVCADCHALNGKCGRCGYVRRGSRRPSRRGIGVLAEYAADPNRVAVR